MVAAETSVREHRSAQRVLNRRRERELGVGDSFGDGFAAVETAAGLTVGGDALDDDAVDAGGDVADALVRAGAAAGAAPDTPPGQNP